MQNLQNIFNGKTFKYCGKIYTVRETKIVNHKAVILTDGSSFVKTESEMEAFMDDIEFIDVVKNDVAKRVVEWIPPTEVRAISSPLHAEIIIAESNAQKVSNKLMDMFEILSDSPTDETYKQAAAMVNMSNSIMNVQMTQIKLQSLKR